MSIPESNCGEPGRTLTSAVYLFVSVLGLVSSSIYMYYSGNLSTLKNVIKINKRKTVSCGNGS